MEELELTHARMAPTVVEGQQARKSARLVMYATDETPTAPTTWSGMAVAGRDRRPQGRRERGLSMSFDELRRI
jgi:hypothetical protein